MKDHPYPETNDKIIAKEILGNRKQFNAKDSNYEIDTETAYTTCNSEKSENYSTETQREIILEKGVHDSNFSTRYTIEQDYKPWYQKEKKKEGKPNLKQIYNSWRYGYK
jgi:hypothetical protein